MPWSKNITEILGMAEGGSLRQLFAAIRSALGMAPGDQRPHEVNRAAFTAAVVALAAKLSKSDGVVLASEERAFERLFPVDVDEIENVRWLFQLCARDVAGFESHAKAVAQALADDPELKRHVFEALLHIATVDGVLHEREDHYLGVVGETFGYTELEYRAMRARFVHALDDPYVKLGVPHDLDNEALKAHYLKLVRDNHPDALAAKGLAKELQDVAARKLAAINAAWDQIAKERGL